VGIIYKDALGTFTLYTTDTDWARIQQAQKPVRNYLSKSKSIGKDVKRNFMGLKSFNFMLKIKTSPNCVKEWAIGFFRKWESQALGLFMPSL
jgi:hypothetical protein